MNSCAYHSGMYVKGCIACDDNVDFAAQVDAELANLVSNGFSELTGPELTEMLDRMSERAVRRALEGALWRLRGLAETMRVTAERDGWRAIAAVLLNVVGLPVSDLPPVEIIELREVGTLPARNVAALEQWWADLTKQHEERRRQSAVVGHVVAINERREAIVLLGEGSEMARVAIGALAMIGGKGT